MPKLSDQVFDNVEYNFGPLMASNTNYAFCWDPPGAPRYPPDYRPGLDRYFRDLAHDSGGHENVDSVSAQDNDAAGGFAQYRSRFGLTVFAHDGTSIGTAQSVVAGR